MGDIMAGAGPNGRHDKLVSSRCRSGCFSSMKRRRVVDP
jgi:hypothetical protein